MHRMIAPGLLLGILIFESAWSSPAGAIDQIGNGQPAPVTAKKMGSSKMTEADCYDLGGKITEALNVCGSGKACMTRGQDQVYHAVCITKK